MLIKEYVKDNLTCKVFSDRDSMGRYAADQIAAKMRELLSRQSEINMVFAAAPLAERRTQISREGGSGLVARNGFPHGRIRRAGKEER